MRMGMSGSAGPDPTMVVVVSVLVALVLTVLLWILVIPEKRRPKLSKFFVFLSDLFNFKSLLIEKILKFTYVLLTLFAIVFGFCMLFVVSYGESMALYGVLIMILGPIALRLVYELSMMGVLLVNNVIEINKKMSVEQKVEQKAEKQEEEVTIE